MANYGSATMEQDEGYFHPFAPDGYYRRLDDGMDMSVESVGNSNCGGSMTMSVADSSVGSNNSRAAMLMHQDLRARDNSSHAGHSVANNNNAFRHNHNADTATHNNGSNNNHNHNHNNNNTGHGNPNTGEDVLAVTLMDLRYPTKGLPGYEKWTIDLRKLTLGPAFAQGAFGRLYRGTYNGIEDVAVKILERPENNLERAHLMEQQYSQEVMMLAALKHQNVVRLVGACHKRFLWCIATEYAKGGSVRAFLAKRQNRAVPLKLAVKQALDVARGMEYLHSLGFIHRDLKSDNLLISADKAIKIADFGVARIEVQTEGMTPETGTYRWMAPEMIQRRDYSHKVDVYSFGIVLWELITGNLPFSNMTAVQAAFAVVNKGVRPVIPPDCPVILAQIMSKCWDANPDVRPAFSQVVQLLEEAQTEIVTTVGKARFRCGCLAPLTFD